MASPSWLAGTFAVVMILIAAYSMGRLVFSRLRGRAIEYDADALHAVMGAAMAGMLVPQLNLLPDRVWAALFAVAAAWFGWHAVRGRALSISGASRCRYPVPHLIECAAMVYMLLPIAGSPPARAGAGMAMPGMGAPAGLAPSFPALAVILALFMAGYIVWTTDRLATLVRARPTAAVPGGIRNRPVKAAAAPSHHNTTAAPRTPGATRTRQDNLPGRPMLAPKLAACCKIAMSIAMGYMLVLML